MARYAFLRAVIWAAGILGAALFAASIAALALPGATLTPQGFAASLWEKLPAVLAFNPGVSKITGMMAAADAATAFGATLELLLLSLLVALAVGVPLGILMMHEKARLVAVPLVQLAGSVPVFCGAILIGLMLGRGIAPGAPAASVFATLAAGGALGQALFAIAPLVLTVGLAGAGAVALSVSTALATALAEPYREALLRFGLTRGEILRVYVARHAFALSLKDIGDVLFALFAAAAVAEWIFAWPGAGAGFIRAVALEDWTVAAIFIFTIALVRFTADFAGALLSRYLLGGGPPTP